MAACGTGVLALLGRVCILKAGSLESWGETGGLDGDGNDDEGEYEDWKDFSHAQVGGLGRYA